jgi:DNA polymerase
VNTTAKQALELRGQLSKSSVSKLDAIVARTAQDGRLRNSYKYYGAHTGRWSGEGVQTQNLTRGSIDDVAGATEAILNGKPITEFGLPLEVVSSCIRSAFRAPSGSRFVVCDLSQIELRVLAWVTNCKDMLDAFSREADMYVEFAANKMYSKPAAEVTKFERQIAKSAVLGAGYGIGGGAIETDKNGDKYRSGLWGYAQNMGVDMAQEDAQKAVDAFRAAYEEIPLFWRNLQSAALQVLMNGGMVEFGRLAVGAVPNKLLWIQLPSERRLHYVRPRVELSGGWSPQMSYEDGSWRYKTLAEKLADPATADEKVIIRKKLYGGLLTENVVQAIARDVLAEGMLRAHEMGFEICLHTHDEIGCIVPSNSPLTLTSLTDAMIKPIDWAPGLLLKAEGYEAVTYKK